MSDHRIPSLILTAVFVLAAGAAYADPATDQPSSVTIDNPTSVTIESNESTSVSVTTPAVSAAAPAEAAPVASAAPLTLQERDEFVMESSMTLQNARLVAERIDTGLRAGTIQGFERNNLERLQNNVSEAEAMSLKFQRASVDTLAKDYKAAQASMSDLADAYYPAAAMFGDVRQIEEGQVQLQIAQLEQHKQTLQATVGASQLSGNLKSAAKATANKLDESIKASQKRLTKLQSAKDQKWASLRKDAQQHFDRTDDHYHETLERITRPS